MSNSRHEADLDWFLGIGMTKFVRSPFGAMLESQHSKYINPREGQENGGTFLRGAQRKKNGRLSAKYDGDDEKSSVKPPTHDDYTGLSLEDDKSYFPTSWSYMSVKAEQHHAHPEPELRDLHRFGKVSRALYRLEKSDSLLVSVLMAYAGDRGYRWIRERGEGRLLAVYPLTSTGSRWVKSMRDRSLADIDAMPDGKLKLQAQEDFNALRDDERLALECFLQDKSPTDIRRQRLKKIEEEARALHRLAMVEYEKVAG